MGLNTNLIYVLPMVATAILGAVTGWFTAWLNARTQRHAASGRVDTAPAQEVYQGDWRIIGWQDKELTRLREAEKRSLECERELVRLKITLERLEAKYGITPPPEAAQ